MKRNNEKEEIYKRKDKRIKQMWLIQEIIKILGMYKIIKIKESTKGREINQKESDK